MISAKFPTQEKELARQMELQYDIVSQTKMNNCFFRRSSNKLTPILFAALQNFEVGMSHRKNARTS